MKRFLLWSFERGSVQYDVICVVILAFIFIMPPAFFDDRPDFMRILPGIKPSGRAGMMTESPYGSSRLNTEQDAVDRLKEKLGEPVTISRTEPVYDAAGALVAYSIWVAEVIRKMKTKRMSHKRHTKAFPRVLPACG